MASCYAGKVVCENSLPIGDGTCFLWFHTRLTWGFRIYNLNIPNQVTMCWKCDTETKKKKKKKKRVAFAFFWIKLILLYIIAI